MVMIQADLTEKANKKLEQYVLYNSCISKVEALNIILANIDLSKDKEKWWAKESED